MLLKNNAIGLLFLNMSFVIKVPHGICSRQPHKGIYTGKPAGMQNPGANQKMCVNLSSIGSFIKLQLC